jgi:hypothetical protein
MAEESHNAFNFQVYKELFMFRFPSLNVESNSVYIEVLNNLNKQINHNGPHLETKSELYRNFVCYNNLYKEYIYSKFDELHEGGLFEVNIAKYEEVRVNLETMYKSAKNQLAKKQLPKNKSRNRRGNYPMTKFNITNPAMSNIGNNSFNTRVRL